MKYILIAAALFQILHSPVSVAEDFLNGETLQKTLCGKTFTGANLEKGSTFKVFYPEKCDEVIHRFLTGGDAGNTVTWPLRIDPDGKHCVTNGGKEKCAQFILSADGVYQAMRDGKIIYTRFSPEEGNHLDN